MRTRLDRLMVKQEDGSFKVVGYQKWEGGKIYHTDEIILDGSAAWVDIKENCCHAQFECTGTGIYIPHDRIDQYTGVDVDGVKVFERDEWQYNRECLKTGIVFYSNEIAAFLLGSGDISDEYDEIGDNIKFIKCIGIEGVN